MNFNFIIRLLLISSVCFTQVSVESIPKSFNLEEDIVIPTRILPAFDVQNFLLEDENEMRSIDTKPYRFANPIEVDFNMDNSGVWTVLEDGSAIWQLRIESRGAFSLNIIYDIFDINYSPLASLDVKIHSLCTWKNIINFLKNKQLYSEEQISSLEKFLQNPDIWRDKYE